MEEYDVMDRETGTYVTSLLYDRLSVEGAARVHKGYVFVGRLSNEVVYA